MRSTCLVAVALASSFLLLACAGGELDGAADAGDEPGGPDGGPRPDGGVGDDGGVDPTCNSCQVQFSYVMAGASSVELRGNFAPDGWSTGVAMSSSGDTFSTTLELPHGRSVQYKFVVDGATWVPDPTAPASVSDGVGGENSALVVDCGCAPTAFDWRDAVMYFVLVDRFADGDSAGNSPLANVEPAANFAGGDLLGLRQKIEAGYFDALGVNVLWISAPIDNADGAGIGDDGYQYSSYHGYWPSDLEAVETRVGDMNQLVAVVDAAHRRGMKVVMDYVMNHVHVESPTFTEHPEWFWPLMKNGQECVCGGGCGWEAPDGLRCWFRNYLPDFNFQNADARAFSVANAVGWIQRTGLDGFRLDAVKHIETSWITDLRARVNAEIEFGGTLFYMVGETYTGDKGLIRSYVDPETMLDGQFDFPLRAEVARTLLMRQGSMVDLASFLAANDGYYGAGSLMGTFIGNHDVPRSIHLAEDSPLFGEWDSGKNRAWQNLPGQPASRAPYERLGLSFTLLMTLPGIPLVYYGDEIGLAGGGDPDNRRLMPWSGVSADQEWLRGHVAKLAKIRAQHAALRRGARTALGASNDALVYKMSDAGDTVFVALNRGDAASAAAGLPAGDYHDLVTATDVTAPLSIPARSSLVLVPR